MSNVVLRGAALLKKYKSGEHEVQVLNGVDFSLSFGEKIAILGASGSGKSTLLNILAGLDQPDEGEVWLSGIRLTDLNEKRLCKWRNESLGFVYQFHHLLPEFSAVENVAMPLIIGGLGVSQAKTRAIEMLTKVSLLSRIKHFPSQLSGGERQRVAIARALVTNPACVLMDEPTGNLDAKAGTQILELIDELSNLNTAFVLVTHSLNVADRMNRTFELSDGLLQVRSS